jgi:beta-phosphoglucomutase-like phosphatase (HAD superfamily)
VAEGKPSPQIFQLAARKLGAEPGRCVVIEDAVAGVAAAKNAGMKCVAVTTSHPADKIGAADLLTESLENIGVADIAGLVITR